MNFENLLQTYPDLIKHMQDNGFSKSYILLLKTEINWLKKNGETVDSYESACKIRESQTKSYDMQRRYRLEYGILKRFDVDHIYPDHRRKEPLKKRGAYHLLNSEFKAIVDNYREADLLRGIKDHTVKGNASALSCFLYVMQEKKIEHFSDIREDDTMSFFTDDSGNLNLSNGYRKQISLALKANLGDFTKDARRILAYLPKTRPHRKNIQYLQPEEIDCLHEALDPDSSTVLSKRNRAIGTLLFFTGLRACDIASLTLDEIDWVNDEIRLTQNKTSVPLTLPLTASVGNAIYDYITLERPESSERQIFLGELRPYDPLKASAIFYIASKIYDAAGIRISQGERRGSHLFRYHVATTFIGNGIQRPVVSSTLGHDDPASLDYYTFADIKHLRNCALSIESFPVREEVFDL